MGNAIIGVGEVEGVGGVEGYFEFVEESTVEVGERAVKMEGGEDFVFGELYASLTDVKTQTNRSGSFPGMAKEEIQMTNLVKLPSRIVLPSTRRSLSIERVCKRGLFVTSKLPSMVSTCTRFNVCN
jgi:hypothetical protein